ncbi:MAG: DNA primase [Nitrospina sp.]|nr:DNA primase [Nitrospina sp.]
MNHHIPDHLIEEIRSRNDILDTISENILLKKSGQNYKGLCPFHSEKTPSFVVSPEKQIYHCFGCGAGGNIFKFIMEMEDLSFLDAIKILAAKCGVTLPAFKPGQTNAKSNERDVLLNINQKAQSYFILSLMSKGGEQAREYLNSRGLNDKKLLADYSIGWATSGWTDTLHQLQNQEKFSKNDLSRAGLIKQKEGAGKNNFYDRFRGRIIFPLQDIHGNLIAFAGRVIGESEPKYLNSPETPLYIKGRHLFGFNRAKEAIRKQNKALIVEGYFDQMRAHQNGIRNTVATCGTALTLEQASLLKNHTKRATLIFDSDSAGQAATKKGFEVLLKQGMSVDVLSLPSGHDPDSFIYQFGPEKFLEKLKNAKPFVETFIDDIIADGDLTTPMGKVAVVNQVLPILINVKNTIERTEWISILTERAKIEDQALLNELKNAIKQDKTIVSDPLQKDGHQNKKNVELYLVRLMFSDKELALKIKEKVKIEDFIDPDLRLIVGSCYRLLAEGCELKVDFIMNQIDEPNIRNLLSEIGVTSIPFDNPKQTVRDCINAINKKAHAQQVEELKIQRNAALVAGESERSQKIQNKLEELRMNQH